MCRIRSGTSTSARLRDSKPESREIVRICRESLLGLLDRAPGEPLATPPLPQRSARAAPRQARLSASAPPLPRPPGSWSSTGG